MKQPDDLVLDLLRRERARLDNGIDHDVQRVVAESQAIVDRWKARPLTDPRALDEIVAYDGHGLPV